MHACIVPSPSLRRLLIFVSLVLMLGGASIAPATSIPQAMAPEPGRAVIALPPETAKPAPASAQDRATLAAAVEANRIARDGLDAQVEATRWQIALGLGGLIFSAVAGLAAIFAALYARNAWRENKRSADIAERMLIGYERPFLLLEVVKSGVTITDNSITFDVTRYRFRNLGRVPALITRRHFELESGADMPDPVDPKQEAGLPVAHGVAVAADAISEEIETGRALPLHSAFRREPKRQAAKKGERQSVYFHGFVEYRDLAGRRWITGFCFAQSDNEAGLQPLSLVEPGGPDPYNYDHQL